MANYKSRGGNKPSLVGFAQWEVGAVIEGVLEARVERDNGAYYIFRAVSAVQVRDREKGPVLARRGDHYALSERWAIAELRRFCDRGKTPQVRIRITRAPDDVHRAWSAEWEATDDLPGEASY